MKRHQFGILPHILKKKISVEKVSFQDKSNLVAKHLNGKQAKKFIDEFNSNPEKCMTLDIPHLVNSVDEYLIKFIQQITMPIRDSRRKLFNADIPPSTQDNQSHVRILYIISLLLFNTNLSCYMPLHYLLTEAILCHGRSTELIRVFNKLGIVASLDTSSRLGTHVVEKRIVEGIRPSLQFGIATIDNVDILQSHAVVSSLDATRNFSPVHSTTTTLCTAITT